MIAASAPGRCGIVGNPSDIYGGFVVSCSVPERNGCELTKRDGGTLTPRPPLPIAPSSQKGEGEIDFRLWNAATKRYPLEGFEFRWKSEIPRSSGLSGSTALLASTLATVLAARGEAPLLNTIDERTAFAELLRDVELNEAGIVCGYQDATMIVHGGLNGMDFAGKHPIENGPRAKVTPLQAELPFLLITTGVERLSGSVHGPMRDRWLAGDREVRDAMVRIADLGRSGAEALLKGDWNVLAEAMAENHELVAKLGGSGDAIDRLIANCKQHGALAAKLAGAGLGGTVIALTENPVELEARLRQERYERFLRPEITEGLRYEDVMPGVQNK